MDRGPEKYISFKIQLCSCRQNKYVIEFSGTINSEMWALKRGKFNHLLIFNSYSPSKNKKPFTTIYCINNFLTYNIYLFRCYLLVNKYSSVLRICFNIVYYLVFNNPGDSILKWGDKSTERNKGRYSNTRN